MLHNNVVYCIVCTVLCASVAFAAQEPLTPEVASDSMLVAPTATSDGGKASAPQKPVDTVVTKPEAPTPDISYKPTLPVKDTQKPATVPPVQPVNPVPTKPTPALKEEEKGIMVPVPPLTPSMGQLTYLRGKLEATKLNVAIAEQEARLRQINVANTAPIPMVQAMPPIPAIPLDMLLDSQKTKPVKTPSFVSPAKRQTGVVSIQGVNGVLSATIATAKGTVTVKQGDNFGGGKVESISYNQVMVRSGKKTAPIPFVE